MMQADLGRHRLHEDLGLEFWLMLVFKHSELRPMRLIELCIWKLSLNYLLMPNWSYFYYISAWGLIMDAM